MGNVDCCASVHDVFAIAVPQVLGLLFFVVGEARHAASAERAASSLPGSRSLCRRDMVGGALRELLFLKIILEADTAFHLGVCEWLSFRSRITYLRNIP